MRKTIKISKDLLGCILYNFDNSSWLWKYWKVNSPKIYSQLKKILQEYKNHE